MNLVDPLFPTSAQHEQNSVRTQCEQSGVEASNRLMPELLRGMAVTPEKGRKMEQPWHRMAAYLIAANYPVTEVAKAVEHSTQAVYDILHTPWFQEQVTAAIEANGGKDLIEQFKAQVGTAHAIECQLLADEKVSPAVRANIAQRQIERIYGKATQRVEIDNVTKSDNPVAEVERLEQEVKRLHKATHSGSS